MINIFVLVTILGHLPVILSAKSKGSENMEQILIVEDDSFLNKMLDYNLTADGYGVTSALNARTAAEAIRQREFDLVLLDINLRGNAALWAVQSASIAALRAARLQCENLSLGGSKGGYSLL